MLAIRLQRTGRKGHAQFRVIVQESRLSPTSGRLVAALGTYNPHTHEATLDTEKASFYLNNGAQPSPRIVRLFEKQGIALPAWVEKPTEKNRSIKNTDKLRKNQPKEEPVAVEAVAEETSTESTEE